MKVFKAIIIFIIAFSVNAFDQQILDLLNKQRNSEIGNFIDDSLATVLYFSVAYLLNSLLHRFFWDGFVKRVFNHSVPSLIRQSSDFIIYTITLLIVVHSIFNKSLFTFIAAFSAIGVIMAFGLRGLVSDIMTGIAINLEQPFKIGDWIIFRGVGEHEQVGQVHQINWRTTHLIAENKNYIVIPNREIGNYSLVNYSLPQILNRFEINITLDYTISTEEAKRILLSATTVLCTHDSFASKQEPKILISKLSHQGVEYLVRYWITPWHELSPTTAADLVYSSILKHLRAAGITPSYRKLEHFQEPKPEVLNKTSQAQVSMLKMLRLLDFFLPLNDKELEYIAKNSHEALWHPTDELITQNDQGETMFVVLQGLLEIFIHDKDKKDYSIGFIEAGEFFGELSLLTGEPRTATVRALTSVLTLEISKKVFEKILSDRPKVGEKIAKIVATRQLETTKAKEEHRKNASQEKLNNKISAQIYSKIIKFFNQQ